MALFAISIIVLPTTNFSTYPQSPARRDPYHAEIIENPTSKHFVHYYGCQVARAYTTATILEHLDMTLTLYISVPKFEALDKTRFCEALEFAVEYIYRLGLAACT